MLHTKTMVPISKRKINNIRWGRKSTEQQKIIAQAEMSTSSDCLKFCMYDARGCTYGRTDSANSDVLWL